MSSNRADGKTNLRKSSRSKGDYSFTQTSNQNPQPINSQYLFTLAKMQSPMRSALRFKLLILIICCTKLVFAQDNAFKLKEDSLQSANNLTDWIYERLDYVSIKPQQRFTFLQSLSKTIWRKPKTDLEKQAWLDYLNTVGYYQLQEGKILNAIDSYENAFGYFEKNKSSLKGYDIIEYTLKPLSNNYTRLGDYERALFLQKKSIEILQRQSNLSLLPPIYGNMAISYRSMGNLAEAEKSIQNGLKIAKPNEQINILLNNIYADILFDEHKLQEAKKLIEKNIAKQNLHRENAYWLLSAHVTAGNINLEMGNFILATNHFNQSLLILNKYFNGFKIREKANILTQLGKTKNLQKQPLKAIEYFNSALKTLKINGLNNTVDPSKIYGENKLVEVFEQLAHANVALKKPDEAFRRIELALITIDKIRSEFADDKTKQRLQADGKNLAEFGIEICYAQYLKTHQQHYLDQILNLSEQSKSRTLLDQIQRNQQLLASNQKDSLFIKKQALERTIIFNERQEIESKSNNKNTDALKFDLALINKQIKEKYKKFNIGSYLTPISNEMQKLPNTRIIEYFFGRDAIYLLNIVQKKVVQVEKIDHAENIKSQIENFSKTYFQHGVNAMINSPKAFFTASNQIYQTLLPNITFKKGEQIIIVPDGKLCYISFDGLITNPNYSANISGWPFLIKSNIIRYAFSLKTLSFGKNDSGNKSFTGLFITHQKNNNKPLLAVQQEADAIKKTIKGDFLFNDDINNSRFVQAFEESKILHIGTHAYLSGKNAEPTLDFENEKIYLFELSSKKTAPSLVVLSACRTADGALADGEGVISLSRGFSSIGTPATIAGLWNVNDQVASIITSNLYKHIADQKSSAEALHLAKLNWLNQIQNSDAMYLPYYWDSLIYMGTDQNIMIKQPINYTWLISGFAFLVLMLNLFIFVRKSKVHHLKKP